MVSEVFVGFVNYVCERNVLLKKSEEFNVSSNTLFSMKYQNISIIDGFLV